MTAILNKKVLLAASVIVAMTALVLGATYAAWQATDGIEGNTISTAVLGITAEGVAAYGSESKPIIETEVLPGFKSSPAERAEVTNDSSMELDLWFYIDPVSGNPGACDATKIAWRASTPGDGSNWMGYGTAIDNTTYETGSSVGNVGDAGDPDNGTFTLVSAFYGAANAVKIADGSNGFGPGEVIAMRQMGGFAEDADYGLHNGECAWTEVFVGTLPDELPS